MQGVGWGALMRPFVYKCALPFPAKCAYIRTIIPAGKIKGPDKNSVPHLENLDPKLLKYFTKINSS